MTRQQWIVVAALIAGAILAAIVEFGPMKPPPPQPDSAGFSLKGKFIGGNAAEHAAAFYGLCESIADTLEKDSKSESPRISTGAQLEDLRIATAEARFLPGSFSQEQPHVSAAAGRFLDERVGTSGGPLDAAGKERWQASLRELAKAAKEAVQ